MNYKSLKYNSVVIMLNKILDAVFPLITYSYSVRMLGVENIGAYSYASSIVHYFIIFAGLGVATYSIREGAKIREDKEKIKTFIGEIFGLNVITSVISYLLLTFFLLYILDNQHIEILVWIISVNIFFSTLGVEWVISIYEQFTFILFRNLILKISLLIMVLTLVHSRNDLILYTVIMTIATSGVNIANYFFAKKRTGFSIIISRHIFSYIVPVLRLFFVQILIDIYSNIDVTMLGKMAGEQETGYYSAALKVYSVLCGMLSSVAIAAFPKISSVNIDSDKDKYSALCNSAFDLIFLLTMPVIVGAILLREEIILLLCGDEFLKSSLSLGLLSIAFGLNIANWYWTRAYILPLKKDNLFMSASLVAAIENVVFNFIIIPIWGHIGAAFTTILAELTITLFCVIFCKQYVKNLRFGNFFKTIYGCVLVIVTIMMCQILVDNYLLRIIIAVPLSVIVYFGVEVLVKNRTAEELYLVLLNKIK